MTDRISKKAVGYIGESAAASYLEENGCKILIRNYVKQHLETDIICEDGEYIVFVEVKARGRQNWSYGTASSAVDIRKQKKLISCAEYYLKEHKTDKKIRFDIIEVYLSNGRIDSINHIKRAFAKC